MSTPLTDRRPDYTPHDRTCAPAAAPPAESNTPQTTRTPSRNVRSRFTGCASAAYHTTRHVQVAALQSAIHTPVLSQPRRHRVDHGHHILERARPRTRRRILHRPDATRLRPLLHRRRTDLPLQDRSPLGHDSRGAPLAGPGGTVRGGGVRHPGGLRGPGAIDTRGGCLTGRGRVHQIRDPAGLLTDHHRSIHRLLMAGQLLDMLEQPGGQLTDRDRTRTPMTRRRHHRRPAHRPDDLLQQQPALMLHRERMPAHRLTRTRSTLPPTRIRPGRRHTRHHHLRQPRGQPRQIPESSHHRLPLITIKHQSLTFPSSSYACASSQNHEKNQET